MIYGSKTLERHYVNVITMQRVDGSTTPLCLIWDDGRRFNLETVGRAQRQATHTHGYALRYDVLVEGRKRILWHDDTGWFVEVRV